MCSAPKAAEINIDKFHAILVAAGQAPMFTFDLATALHRKFAEFYEKEKIACALCHGVAILTLPWRIEGEMKKIGANYVRAGLRRGFATRDGNLITGQQNFSGEETARLLLETLGR